MERTVAQVLITSHTPSMRIAPLAPAPLPDVAGTTFAVGGYRMLQRIGRGGFGEVWRAEAPGGVEAAVKIILRPINDEEGQRERQALELIKNLRHPYLLQTQAYSVLNDRLLIVMELAECTLRDRLRQVTAAHGQGVPVDELLRYFYEVSEALDFLHTRGVQHRDVRPDNILLSQQHAKLADFGLATVLERLGNPCQAGTPMYMAPEVWYGELSRHSDQYSLAASYVELRLGRRLFASTKMMDLMRDHLERAPDLAPLGRREQRVLLRALAKKPGQRYASCGEFMLALSEAVAADLQACSSEEIAIGTEALLSGSGPISRVIRAEIRRAAALQRRWTLAVAVLAMLLIALLLMVVVVREIGAAANGAKSAAAPGYVSSRGETSGQPSALR